MTILTGYIRTEYHRTMRKINNFLTIKEIAEKLKVSQRQVYRWIEAGRIKTFKLGKKVYRIAESDLVRFLNKHKSK